jgi:hypothetical protein
MKMSSRSWLFYLERPIFCKGLERSLFCFSYSKLDCFRCFFIYILFLIFLQTNRIAVPAFSYLTHKLCFLKNTKRYFDTLPLQRSCHQGFTLYSMCVSGRTLSELGLVHMCVCTSIYLHMQR